MSKLPLSPTLYRWMVLICCLNFPFCHTPSSPEPVATASDCPQQIKLPAADSILLDSVKVLSKQADAALALDTFIVALQDQFPANHPVVAYALYQRGVVEYYQQNFQQAAHYYADAVHRYENFQAWDDHNTVCKLYRNISICYYYVPGYLDSVYHYAAEGIQRMNRCPDAQVDDKIRIGLYQWAGIAARELGDLATAADYQQKGVELCRQDRGDYKICAPVFMNFAWTLSDQGQLDSARRYSQAAESLLLANTEQLSAWDSAYLADVYNNRIDIYPVPEAAAAALYAQRQSLSINRRIRPQSRQVAANYANLGYIHTHGQQLDSAEYYLQQAAHLSRELNDSILLAQNLENLADVAFYRGEYEQALQHLEQALIVYYGASNQQPITSALYKYEMILPMSRRAQSLYALHRQNPRSYPLARVLHAYEQVDSLVSALQYSVRAEPSKLAIVSRLRPVYEDLIGLCTTGWQHTQDSVYLNKAFRYLERSKALVLRERRQRGIATDPQQHHQYQQEERQLIGSINRLRVQVQDEAVVDPAALDALHRAELKLKDYRDSLYQHLPSYESYLSEADADLSRKIRRQLTADQIALDYFVGEQNVYVGILTADRMDIRQLPINSDRLDQMVNQMRRAITSYGTALTNGTTEREYYDSTYCATAWALYRQLLSPLEISPSLSRWTIIPDGVLSYLPFSALLTDSTPPTATYERYPYLIKERAVQYQFSLATWYDQSQGQPLSGEGIFAVAPSQPQSMTITSSAGDPIYFSSLRYNEQEANTLRKQYGAQILQGPEASRDAFEAQAAAYRVLHLAGHAYADAAYPHRSFLAFRLSDESQVTKELLFLDQLEKLHLPVDMMVLSACQTADGELAIGEGVISLSRAATLAGARSVVASLWLVNQQSKVGLFDAFYRNLAAGLSKDEALRAAQLDLVQQQADYAHPYHWAAMISTGAVDPIELSRPTLFSKLFSMH